MSKKNQKDKKMNSLHNYFNKNLQTQLKMQQETDSKNQGRKRTTNILNQPTPNKHKSSSPTQPKKFQLPIYMKKIDIEQVLQKCPRVAEFIHVLGQSAKLKKGIVLSILKKYIQSGAHSLWSSKYAPSDCSQLFNIRGGEKIKDWLNAFFQYKNKICEESQSFIDEYQNQKSCKVYKNIRENQWQLLALVVRGRPGVGKASAIRAVAHQMEIDLQECGNDYNQTKYLKQKNQSTQSQSVKTAISRKNKLQKNAQMITKFLPLIEKEKTNQSKKSQMIHNVGNIFPEAEAQKFYNELSRCIQLSKIPFIMTNSGERLPKECEKYDVIEFEFGSRDKVEHILWAIYHLQNLIKLDKTTQIERQHIFEQINNKTQKLKFVQIVSMQKINELCSLYNYRLDFIFTFMENHSDLQSINFTPILIEKFKLYSASTFLDQITFLDFQHLQIKPHPRPQTVQKDEGNTQESEGQRGKQEDMSAYLRRLAILTIEDSTRPVHHSPILCTTDLDKSQWQNHPSTCIDISVHKAIKARLVHNVNLEITSTLQRNRSTVRLKELRYLSMLIRQKRNSRNSKASDDSLHKFFDQNQSVYLKEFGNLIRPE